MASSELPFVSIQASEPVKEYRFPMLAFILKPRHMAVLFLASRLNREQQCAIEFSRVERQVLCEKLGR